MRRAAKVDNSQQPIVDAIEAEGWECWLIRLPCDVVCWHPVLDVCQQMEIKTAAKSGRVPVDQRQEEQRKFLARTSTPIVTNATEALAVLRRRYPSGLASSALLAYSQRLQAEFTAEWEHDQKTARSAMSLLRAAAQEDLGL